MEYSVHKKVISLSKHLHLMGLRLSDLKPCKRRSSFSSTWSLSCEIFEDNSLDKRELSTSDERVSQNCDYVSLITDLSVYLSSRWQRTAFIYFQKSSAWVRRRYCLPPNYITTECLGAKSSLEQFHLYNLIMIFSKRQTENKWCHVLYFKMKRKECVSDL